MTSIKLQEERPADRAKALSLFTARVAAIDLVFPSTGLNPTIRVGPNELFAVRQKIESGQLKIVRVSGEQLTRIVRALYMPEGNLIALPSDGHATQAIFIHEVVHASLDLRRIRVCRAVHEAVSLLVERIIAVQDTGKPEYHYRDGLSVLSDPSSSPTDRAAADATRIVIEHDLYRRRRRCLPLARTTAVAYIEEVARALESIPGIRGNPRTTMIPPDGIGPCTRTCIEARQTVGLH